MTRLALRGLAQRKLRAALTAVAVLLGVAMIAGTYIETDQITEAFEDITSQSVEKLDVVIVPPEEFTASFGAEPPTLPARLLRRTEDVPGVEAASGELTAFGNLVVDGETVDTFGAPGIITADSAAEFDPTEAIAGRDPQAPGEAAILEQNASDQGIELGDTIGITTRHGVQEVEVVGLLGFGEGASSLGGTTYAELIPSEVERLFDLQGRVTAISVIAEPGVSPESLAARIQTALPGAPKVRTASESAQESADEINDQIGSFLTPALLALAGAAVLVGAFIIFNTFSITVAQRMREFAMLRSLGATRGQILRVVIAEALVIGVAAFALGLAVGIGVAKLLNALFDAVGLGIPRTGIVLAPRTIAMALAVGIGVTLVSALVPALRATRVPPVAALSGTPPRPSRRSRRVAAILSALFALAGAVLIARGLFGGGGTTAKLSTVGGGAVLGFIGIALAARYLVRPLAAVIGWPIQRLFRTPGRLARENAERNPGRTAITSAALMVGLGLAVFVAVFADGLRSSISRQIDELVRADVLVYGENFQPFSPRVEQAVADVEGVDAAVPQLFDQLEVNGEPSNFTTDVLIGVSTEQLDEVYTFEWVEGDDSLPGALKPGETLIEEQFAKRHGIEVGEPYDVVTPTGGEATLTPIGIYRDPTILQGSLTLPKTLASVSNVRDPVSLLVAIDDSADAGTVEAEIERALERFPSMQVENKREYRETLDEQLNQIVYLLYALLAMSLVISMFGIANSLFLSIHERTSELGILRAIGATRSQIRRIIRYESVITAVIGGLLGTAVGVVFAWMLIESLSEFGFSLSIPSGQLLVFLLLAVVVGVLGAIAPARRAARTDVLAAIREE